MFECEKDVLDWYENQPRVINEEFLRNIPWDEVSKHPLNPDFVPVLFYMRDVESFTDIWYRNLLRTPTGRNPIIRRFMDRWGVEELQHGELLNRFLNEAGFPTSSRWMEEARAKIPFSYKAQDYVYSLLVNLFGKYFSGTHMVWGAINEVTTLQGYRQLWRKAGHPVLEHVLRAIAQEESSHSHFYWSIARLKLERSKFARDLATFTVRRFWAPVGVGAKPEQELDYLITKLFKGQSGVAFFDKNVNQRIEQLPGFMGMKVFTERVARVAL